MGRNLSAPESHLAAIGRLRELAPEIQSALEGIAQQAGDEVLVAYIDGYRSRLNALVNETAQLLGWIEPARSASVVRNESEVDARRAKLAAARLKQRQEVAELRANMQTNRDAGFPTDASERDLDRMRDDRVRLFGENNYVFGLAKVHQLTAAEWRALADAYQSLFAEAGTWTRKQTVESRDGERIAVLMARFGAALVPCGHALTHDVDADWLASLLPDPEPTQEARDLATVDSLQMAIGASRVTLPVTPSPVAPNGIERCRLKADVARTKGRIERAESRGRRDEDASLELTRLQTRHRVEFHQDGYVFGFSAAHRMDAEAWDELARAYDDLADAFDRGVASEADATVGQAAVDRLRKVIAPIGRALRHDEDADDLQERLWERSPRRIEADDPLAAFLPPPVFENAAAAISFATAILEAGVRPSDPRMREPLLDWIEELDTPALEPLVRELRLEIARREAEEDEVEDATPDPAYLALRDRVREVTRGKRLLMVGGLNREETRRAILAELELVDLHWPSADEHKTKPADFDLHVDRADLVVKNRFCRRGYQRALSLANEQGKPTVALPGGYSPRQVVRGIAEALRL